LLHCLLLRCVVQLLSLSGGSMESPVMDTMMELDAANAYSIMSYMSIQVNTISQSNKLLRPALQ
jgi:hypothetical protein